MNILMSGFLHVEIVFEDAFERFDAANFVVDDQNGGQGAQTALAWRQEIGRRMYQQIRGKGSPRSQSTMRFPPNRVCIWTKA